MSITRVNFKERRVLSTEAVMEEPIMAAYKKISEMADRPGRILEAVGEPIGVNIQRIFPFSDVTRWAYSHGDDAKLMRRYLSLVPPNSNYDLVIATHLIEEWTPMPWILLHRWPELLLKSLGMAACIVRQECTDETMTYIRTTMRIAFNDVQEFKEGAIHVSVGRGLRQ